MDLILHAGDITGTEVLEELLSIAPVVAVKGNHDSLDLPEKAIVEVGGKRIGLIHGQRPRWQEIPGSFASEIFPGRLFWWGGFHRQVVLNFKQVDAIIFGHFHQPYVGYRQNVLLFNPGAIFHMTPQRARAELSHPTSLWRRVYLLNSLRRMAQLPTVGLLTIEHGTIKAEIFSISE